MEKLLATEGLKKFFASLKTPKEKDDFKGHMRRYMSIYLPDCPFEVNATNRYTIGSYEASITARRFIRRNETIKYLAGSQVTITPEEEAQLALRKKDFSLVVSSRSKLTSLFMGPARFANHDCDANARLVTRGQAEIEIIACKDIEIGDEITVTYSESYFGEDNCDCLCQTCEVNLTNGWKQADGSVPLPNSIEAELAGAAEGYSLRRRRRDNSVSIAGSRASSVTRDIRPRILKTKKSQRALGDKDRASTTDSRDPEEVDAPRGFKRNITAAGLSSPPVTPVKRFKTNHIDICGIPVSIGRSRDSSETDLAPSSVTSDPSVDMDTESHNSVTDATSPDSVKIEIPLPSPDLSPVKQDLETPNQQLDVSELVLPTTEIAPRDSFFDTPATTEPSLPTDKDTSATHDEASPARSLPNPSRSWLCQETREDSQETILEHDDLDTASVAQSSGYDSEETILEEDMPRAGRRSEALTLPKPKQPPVPKSLATAHKTKNGRVSKKLAKTRRIPPKKTLKGRVSEILAEEPIRNKRTPGDYTLTPRLLSEPDTAWIHCTNCNTAFVQRNAYYTQANCYRCERHSKLYGYVWPKTTPAGKGDKEERVLDHRIINRFLHPEDEAKARGRKHWKERLGPSDESSQGEEPRRRGRPRVRGVVDTSQEAEDAGTGGPRRSGRARRASAKAMGDD